MTPIGVSFELHLSTQSSVLNEGAALFYKNLGVTRIVLAREANREDILAIKKLFHEIQYLLSHKFSSLKRVHILPLLSFLLWIKLLYES